MKKIPSFTVDHIRLLRGIYVSRKDTVGNEIVTTFDIRMKEPNREPCLSTSGCNFPAQSSCMGRQNYLLGPDGLPYWQLSGCKR